MTQTLNPYLNFAGEARAALEFYRGVFGGDLSLLTFAEGGMASGGVDPDHLMHGQLTTPSGFTVMASDVPPSLPIRLGENQFQVALSGTDADELHGYWSTLEEGADVTAPLAWAPWGDEFGTLVDRFGVPWLFNIGSAG